MGQIPADPPRFLLTFSFSPEPPHFLSSSSRSSFTQPKRPPPPSRPLHCSRPQVHLAKLRRLDCGHSVFTILAIASSTRRRPCPDQARARPALPRRFTHPHHTAHCCRVAAHSTTTHARPPHLLNPQPRLALSLSSSPLHFTYSYLLSSSPASERETEEPGSIFGRHRRC